MKVEDGSAPEKQQSSLEITSSSDLNGLTNGDTHDKDSDGKHLASTFVYCFLFLISRITENVLTVTTCSNISNLQQINSMEEVLLRVVTYDHFHFCLFLYNMCREWECQ